MSQGKDGGPAFPRAPVRVDFRSGEVEFCESQDGMSLRDYFAAQALIGMFACGGHRDVASGIGEEQQLLDMSLTASQIGHFAEARLADMAYAMADAMLKARAQQPEAR